MMRIFAPLFCALIGTPVLADTLVAARTLRSGDLITPADIHVVPDTNIALSPDQIIGMEARVMIYQGRPITAAAVQPAALVERNQIVTLIFATSGLQIATEGRSLSRGSVGARVRAMNLASRTTVTGTVLEDGTIKVGH